VAHPLESMAFSVLMSIYSKVKPDELLACLGSLSGQTIKADEVILVEDGPIAIELSDIIKQYKNFLNIISVPLSANVGLAQALNVGIMHCQHEVVFRMDADDVALPERFEKQMRLFKQGYDLVGGAIQEVDGHGQAIAIRQPPSSLGEIKKQLARRNPFNHMTVAFRASFVRECGGYPDVYLKEDYALWASMISKGARAANTGEILVRATAGREMYRRRGGFRNLKSEVALQRHLLRCGVTSFPKAIMYGSMRSVVFLMPSNIRGQIYELFLRKKGTAQ